AGGWARGAACGEPPAASRPRARARPPRPRPAAWWRRPRRTGPAAAPFPPTLRVVPLSREYDGYPGGASVTFTLAPRLTIAPARGVWETARPLPRSSGSSDAWASRRVAVRAPSPKTSGTPVGPGPAETSWSNP